MKPVGGASRRAAFVFINRWLRPASFIGPWAYRAYLFVTVVYAPEACWRVTTGGYRRRYGNKCRWAVFERLRLLT
jgi:hypothetical protein